MASDLYNVSVLERGGRAVVLETRPAHPDTPAIPLPGQTDFFFRVLCDGERAEDSRLLASVGERVKDKRWVARQAPRYVVEAMLLALGDVPRLDEPGMALPWARYRVVAVEERWVAHLRPGSWFPTAAFAAPARRTGRVASEGEWRASLFASLERVDEATGEVCFAPVNVDDAKFARLHQALHEQDDAVADAAMQVLARVRSPESVPHLVGVLSDPLLGARATEVLGRIGDARAALPLVARLGDAFSGEHPAGYRATVRALGALGPVAGRAARAALARVAERAPDAVLRALGAVALARVAGVEAARAAFTVTGGALPDAVFLTAVAGLIERAGGADGDAVLGEASEVLVACAPGALGVAAERLASMGR